jgi:hypothetical protein
LGSNGGKYHKQLSVFSCRFSVGEQWREITILDGIVSHRQNRRLGRPSDESVLTTGHRQLPTDQQLATDTDNSSAKCLLDSLAERFAVDSAGGFFGSDFHHRSHLGFRGRSCLRYRILDQLIYLILGQRLREVFR